MSVDLATAKAFLRITHSDDDAQITLLMNSAAAALERYAGDDFDAYDEDVDAAQLLYLDYLYYPRSDVTLDPVTGWPMAVAALLLPFRLPTAN